jgi:S1-C subfamily serine protease
MLGLICAMLLGQPAELPRLPEAAAKVALRATVRVTSTRDTGSGVVIGRSGPVAYVLTAAHVVDQADRLEIDVLDPDGKGTGRRVFGKVTVVAKTSALAQDLALLRVRVDGGGLTAVLPLRRSEAAALSTPCPAFSAGDNGVKPTLKSETILAVARLRRPGASASSRCWKCQAAPVAGRSGGPLLHADGTLLGICTGGDRETCYYTHVAEIRDLLRRNGLGFLAP